METAKLNLEFTQVKAPVDGYVTNLNLRLGSQAVANQAALALVDVNSYWIHGFFRENYIAGIRAGDRAIVTLMSYPDNRWKAVSTAIGWGISQDDGSTGYDLLPTHQRHLRVDPARPACSGAHSPARACPTTSSCVWAPPLRCWS